MLALCQTRSGNHSFLKPLIEILSTNDCHNLHNINIYFEEDTIYTANEASVSRLHKNQMIQMIAYSSQ